MFDGDFFVAGKDRDGAQPFAAEQALAEGAGVGDAGEICKDVAFG